MVMGNMKAVMSVGLGLLLLFLVGGMVFAAVTPPKVTITAPQLLASWAFLSLPVVAMVISSALSARDERSRRYRDWERERTTTTGAD